MHEATGQLDFNFEQGDLLEFPRDLGELGWHNFHSEQRKALQALEQAFGIVLNKRVRLRLRGWDEDFEGKLVLDSLLVPSLREKAVRLRLGRLTFDHTDIEFCQMID